MAFKKYLLITTSVFLLALALFVGAVFFRYKSWSSEARPAEKLAAYFSHVTKSDFQYSDLRWSLFPFPTVRFSNPVFKFKSDLRHELKATSIDLRLDLKKFILGEVGFSRLHLVEGDWRGQIDAPKGVHDFVVEHIDLKTSALVTDRPVKIYMSGDSGGRRKAVVIHGELHLPPIDAPRLDNLGFEVQVLTRNFKFDDSPVWELSGWIPSSGLSDFLIELKRDSKSDQVYFSGEAGLHDLAFRSAENKSAEIYKAGHFQVKLEGSFNPKTDELKFSKCAADLPFAQFNLQGAYLPHAREFRALVLSLTNTKLEDLFARFPDVKKQIPEFIQLSGIADGSLSLNGFLNRLKIYGDFDLTRSFFGYGRFFEKPKDKPFRIKTDTTWAEQKLTGEFSGSMDALTFKGNLPEWRPTGELKINVITNAFAAASLSEFIPLLSSYELGGNLKLFANWDGKIHGTEPFQKMFNMSMQDGKILRKGTGSGFKDLDINIDFGPLLVEAKAKQFSLGGSFFEAAAKALHPESNPQWEGHLSSEKVIVSQVWKEWKDFWGGENTAWLESLHPWLQKLVLSDEPYENLVADFSSQNQSLKIQSFESRVLGGKLSGGVSIQGAARDQKTQVQVSGENMDAAGLFKLLGNVQPSLEGRANWQADLTSEPVSFDASSKTWTGPVSFHLKNGFVNHFDYLRALKQIDPLKDSARDVSDRMAIQSLSLVGRIEDDLLKTNDFTLIGDQVQIQGEGSMSGEGQLNFRLQTRLATPHFKELFPKRAGDFVSDQDAFFGPVTLLASGPLDGLTLKPDPAAVAELAARYARKKTEALSKYL